MNYEAIFLSAILGMGLSNLVTNSFVGSLVRPKVVKSVHFCPTTGNFTTREYRDITSNMGLPTGSVYPTRVISIVSALMISISIIGEGPLIKNFCHRMKMVTYW